MSEAARAPMIYGAISAAMADITAIGKDKYNQQQGFKFRGIDDVMNVLKPILTKHQIFTVPTVLEQTREIKTTLKGGELRYSLLKIAFSFYAPDGSHVDAVTLGEGMDSGDKASNKAMAIAYKYALFQVFCIPTEEMIDPDGESHEVAAKKPEGKPVTVTKAEKVPGTWNANAYLMERCKGMGLTMQELGKRRNELIERGEVADIPSSVMTKEQADALLIAIAG